MFTHLIAHATIVPSPYQDSLRRDGGKRIGNWGTGYETSLALVSSFQNLSAASTRILGVVYTRALPNPSWVTDAVGVGFLGTLGATRPPAVTSWAPRHTMERVPRVVLF